MTPQAGSNPPSPMDPEFLDWFRRPTEAQWADHATRPFHDYQQAGVGGVDWQPGWPSLRRWLRLRQWGRRGAMASGGPAGSQ